jgi:hypothetical protein
MTDVRCQTSCGGIRPLSSDLCHLKKVDPPERGHVRAGLGIGAGVEGGRTRRPNLSRGYQQRFTVPM